MRTVVVGNEDGRRRYYDRPRSDEVPKKEGSATALLLRFSRQPRFSSIFRTDPHAGFIQAILAKFNFFNLSGKAGKS